MDERTATPPDPELEPRVIHEASGVIAVWKPPGLATQAPPGLPAVEAWLRTRLYGDTGGYVGVPHRLDRAVSGVLLLAATPRAARKLSRQFERREVGKTYVAVVTPSGTVAPEGSATWRDMVEKVPDEARARIVPPGASGGREAVTNVRVLSRLADGLLLLLQLEPVTGRMHQLRLQAAARGLPILGDDLYGAGGPTGAAAAEAFRRRPIALHARRIEYVDPDTGRRVRLEAELPASWPVPAAPA